MGTREMGACIAALVRQPARPMLSVVR
jgi:hypothetical protein